MSALILSVLIIVLAVYGWCVGRTRSRHMREVMEALERVGRGDFSVRLMVLKRRKSAFLAVSVNRMVESVSARYQRLLDENIQFQTVLNGMIEGVLLVNHKEEVLLANPALQTMFTLSPQFGGKRALDYLRHIEASDAIAHVVRYQAPLKKEIVIPRRDQDAFVMVNAVPLAMASGGRGAVAVFYEVTELRKLEAMRREFVASVSHELKTPLTSIRGYAETLCQDTAMDEGTRRRFLEKIDAGAKRLQMLVEDILYLSEIESGRMQLHRESIDLDAFISRVLRDYADAARAKDLSLSATLPAALPPLIADPHALESILGNLIDNAIKYTPSGGRIVVSAAAQGSEMALSVADTGAGIAAENLDRVFERFFRVDKSRAQTVAGTGLGLSIVKHLAQAHEGRVDVESALGKGARFSVVLPLS